MKKAYFLASMLAVGALCSCSNDTEVISGVPQGGNNANDDLQPIVLSLGAPSISVRGTGTVGSTAAEGANKWAGEYLHLVMMEKELVPVDPEVPEGDKRWNLSSFKYNAGVEQTIYNFNHLPVKAPEGSAGTENTSTLTWKSNFGDATKDLKYYPTGGVINEFFAYRIDDAAATYTPGAGVTGMDEDGIWALDDTYNTWAASVDEDAPEVPTVYAEDGTEFFESENTPKAGLTEQYVYFQINGTQDLMCGAAKAPDPNTEKRYSNVSARNQIVPNIAMQHLLTRLTFQVKGGSETTQNLTVTGIRVYSKDKGRMLVAYQGAEKTKAELIEWNPAIATDAFVLNHRGTGLTDAPNTQMAPVTADNEAVDISGTTPSKIGHAMLVAPFKEGEYIDADSQTYGYKLEVDVKETLGTYETTTTQTGIIKIADIANMQGSSYDVTITLYGSEAITVEATLGEWENGGSIDASMDGEEEPALP